MRLHKHFFILCLTFILPWSSYLFSQENIQFTQYMYNQRVFNPAYALNSPTIIKAGVFYKQQWSNLEGAPRYASAFIQAPLFPKLETGFSFIQNNIGNGIIIENNFSADLAYLLNLTENRLLSFGAKVGYASTNHSGIGRLKLNTGDISTDPAFSSNIDKSNIVLGTGIFFFTEKYYLGLSTPNLSRISNNHSNTLLDIFLAGGYVFDLNDKIKIKPSGLARFLKDGNTLLDLSALVIINDKFEVGASHRLYESFSLLANTNIITNLTIGYSFDWNITDVSIFGTGSHEFFILYKFDMSRYKDTSYIKSPRYF